MTFATLSANHVSGNAGTTFSEEQENLLPTHAAASEPRVMHVLHMCAVQITTSVGGAVRAVPPSPTALGPPFVLLSCCFRSLGTPRPGVLAEAQTELGELALDASRESEIYLFFWLCDGSCCVCLLNPSSACLGYRLPLGGHFQAGILLGAGTYSELSFGLVPVHGILCPVHYCLFLPGGNLGIANPPAPVSIVYAVYSMCVLELFSGRANLFFRSTTL